MGPNGRPPIFNMGEVYTSQVAAFASLPADAAQDWDEEKHYAALRTRDNTDEYD